MLISFIVQCRPCQINDKVFLFPEDSPESITILFGQDYKAKHYLGLPSPSEKKIKKIWYNEKFVISLY